MAPIPEDNQEKPPPRDDEELNAFSNGNVATITFSSDSSDENDDNYPDTTGYMLLPQEPGGEDDGDDTEDEIIENSVNASGHVPEHAGRQCESEAIDNHGSIAENRVDSDHLPDEVIQSEGVAAAPTVTASNSSLHPEFLAKFPDGKIPSYMQVPDIPTNSDDVLWNKKREDKNSSSGAEDNKILKAMSGFSLPSENVPEWARNMSEDQWHNVISQQIRTAQPKSDNSHQTKQKSDSLPVHREQKTDDCDWVADFPDT